jgi:hypothetical protein
MGEESTSVPPRSKKACMTWARAARSLSSLPTLKVIQVPRPIIGIFSPVEGMARVMTGPAGAAWLSENAGMVAAAPSEPMNVRRVIRFMDPLHGVVWRM